MPITEESSYHFQILDLRKFSKIYNPFKTELWPGIPPIKRWEITRAVKSNFLIEHSDSGFSRLFARSYHIRRIAFFVKNGWKDEIIIDTSDKYPIIDGNHRYTAAVYLNLYFMRVYKLITIITYRKIFSE